MNLPDNRPGAGAQTPPPYPKYKYQTGKMPKQVLTEEEDKALGPAWSDAAIPAACPTMDFSRAPAAPDLPSDRFYTSSPVVMAVPYPKYKYSKTEPPKLVRNEDEEKALGPDWGDTYIPLEYPKMLFKGDDYMVVDTPEDEKKAGPGWSDKAPKPKAADEEKEPKTAPAPPAKK